jgi:hypothetical protein
MARLDLTINVTTVDGVDIGAGQAIVAANDAMFVNDGKTILKVVNANGAAQTFDLITPGTVGADALAIADKTISIAGSTTEYCGPFQTSIYNQPSGDDAGKVYIDTASSDLTMTAIRVP